MSLPRRGEESLHRKVLMKTLPSLQIPGSSPGPVPSGSGSVPSSSKSPQPETDSPSSRNLPGSAWSWSSGDEDSPQSAGATSASPTSSGSRKIGQFGQYLSLNSTSPIPDWDAVTEQQYLEQYKNSARGQLRDRFRRCTGTYADSRPAPTLDELKTEYANATNGELFEIVTMCAKWMCYGARLSISKGKDVDTAKALEKKWTRCDGTEYTDHKKGIVDQRSKDEVREMLAAAFADIEACIVEAKSDEGGLPIVKAGAKAPDAGKEWY